MLDAPRPAKPLIALTRGDPSGIGPELALKAWRLTREDPEAPAFVIAAEADHLAALARSLGLEAPIARVASAAEALKTFPDALPVLDSQGVVKGAPGKPHPDDAAATIASIETCVGLVARGEAAAVVTNPIAKEILYRAGFAHPGHTEFLGVLAARLTGRKVLPVMLLWSPELAVVPATIHIPLKDVPGRLSTALLIRTGQITSHDFQRRFGVARPRLAFTGLNPHAGEGGAMGREEIDIIAPALAALREAGVCVSGPHPADAMFHAKARESYDVAIAMYHDQALIPIKTLAFDHGVNVTLGLPFIRTSPDHGTAFGIAGQGIADPSSLIAALKLAGRLARRALSS
ncbi:4-hydroxythreonine-4-phosphate dehydrogenase PdxA [Methylocella silvestris]|uniref:4-hydroxythreonine-4-phosphate dehydrogenase n=1 Tax=Methylocella silvestris TaxID=199596 RepID=A0A2J7TCH8_METSI|nr:4-hydroxythreonine-4-phosphate dehydrogenase PdxA [Methylocella silvestris]PNG24471.1 4-hydroxythreonine-4-phosphate dehydrogenase PdxA [Methylocella silvestris]